MQLKQIKAWESHSGPVCLLHALPWNQGGLQYVCKWLHSVQAGLQLLGEGLHQAICAITLSLKVIIQKLKEHSVPGNKKL